MTPEYCKGIMVSQSKHDDPLLAQVACQGRVSNHQIPSYDRFKSVSYSYRLPSGWKKPDESLRVKQDDQRTHKRPVASPLSCANVNAVRPAHNRHSLPPYVRINKSTEYEEIEGVAQSQVLTVYK